MIVFLPVYAELVGAPHGFYTAPIVVLYTLFVAMLLVIPVFVYRHWIQDKGQFPPEMLDDLHVDERDLSIRKSGYLPYLTLAAGILVVIVANRVFTL